MKQFNWISSASTHVGLVRDHNEDSFLDAGDCRLWVVADGMGGHAAGDLASRIVVDRLRDFCPTSDVTTDLEDIEDRLLAANHDCLIRSAANETHKGMGSTVAALYAFGRFCFYLWAGDSRIYRYRDAQLERMTEDHSLVQEMYSLGHLTEREAEAHPSSNVITRAIGVGEDLALDLEYSPTKPGDTYILCSDGLTSDVPERDIAELLRDRTPDSACNALIEAGLKGGGSDNNTVIVVQAKSLSGKN